MYGKKKYDVCYTPFMSVFPRASVAIVACIFVGCTAVPPSTMIDADQAIHIVQVHVKEHGSGSAALTYMVLTDEWKNPHVNPASVKAWAHVTPEEERTSWIVFSFPSDPGLRGDGALHVVNKETGEITRVMYGR